MKIAASGSCAEIDMSSEFFCILSSRIIQSNRRFGAVGLAPMVCWEIGRRSPGRDYCRLCSAVDQNVDAIVDWITSTIDAYCLRHLGPRLMRLEISS